MHEIEVILVLLAAVSTLATLARRIGVPYPIMLVLGGLVLGLIENFLGAVSGLVFIFPKLTFLEAIKAEYKDVGAFIALIVILIFKPSGLLGRNATEKV